MLSHYHGDHFDQVAEEKLQKDLPILTTEHAAVELKARGFTETTALQTWESVLLAKDKSQVKLTAMPGKHGPEPVEALLPPVMGSPLEFQDGDDPISFRLYTSGDTLIFDDLREIPKRFPKIDLALLYLGGTRIMGILLTMDAEQGVEAIRIINPHELIPIHYNDYEVFKSTLEDFQVAVNDAGLGDRVKYLGHGETFKFKSAVAKNTAAG